MNNRIKVLLMFGAMAGIFFSCKKDGEQLAPVLKNTINIINASGDTLNVYENGTRINNGSTLLPSGQYRDMEVTLGTQRYQFKKAGNTNTLLQTELSLQDSTLYTMFVAGETADDVFLLKDSAAVDTFAYVRYVNASPDAGDINFTFSSYPVYNNMPFKSVTPFLKTVAGKVFYSMYRVGESTPFASGNITVAAGGVYTLFSKGLVKATGTNALGARILTTTHLF